MSHSTAKTGKHTRRRLAAFVVALALGLPTLTGCSATMAEDVGKAIPAIARALGVCYTTDSC